MSHFHVESKVIEVQIDGPTRIEVARVSCWHCAAVWVEKTWRV